MNASMNMTTVPKLLANPPVPVLVGGMGDSTHHPDSGSLPHYTIESIRARAETITPLLMAIPDYRPPLRWGINE